MKTCQENPLRDTFFLCDVFLLDLHIFGTGSYIVEKDGQGREKCGCRSWSGYFRRKNKVFGAEC